MDKPSATACVRARALSRPNRDLVQPITRTNIIQNDRGLTIAEIMIALAINAIIVLAVVTLVSNTMLSGKSSENRQELATDFGLLQNYFARTIPNAGGMSVPTDSTFWVEDNCSAKDGIFPDCKQGDRLTIVTSDEGPTCTIVAYDATTGAATLSTVPSGGGPVCCMTSRPLIHNHVMFVNGYDYRQLWMVTADTVACTGTFSKGPMSPNDNVDDTYAWAGGMVIPIHLDTFFWDEASSTFNRYVYDDAGSTRNSGSAQVLADRVLDFQVALGFDFQPADGVITDDGSTLDEWLYNAVGDDKTKIPFVQNLPTYPGLQKNSLRMVAVGWIIGAPNGGVASANNLSVLNGPVRSKANYTLQAGVAKLGARSVYVFN
jgi:Tfp pilus assembly protein PilE